MLPAYREKSDRIFYIWRLYEICCAIFFFFIACRPRGFRGEKKLYAGLPCWRAQKRVCGEKSEKARKKSRAKTARGRQKDEIKPAENVACSENTRIAETRRGFLTGSANLGIIGQWLRRPKGPEHSTLVELPAKVWS